MQKSQIKCKKEINMENLIKELQRLAKNLANIETNSNSAVGILHELNDALEKNAPTEITH